MHKRSKIVGLAVLIVLLTAALFPAARLLSGGEQEDTKENRIAQTLERYRLHQAQRAYAVVEPLMEIEDAWAIEDTREESADPLVTRMYHNGAEMGFDAQSRTFYCPLDSGEWEDWPNLEILAGGYASGKKLRVAWIDDYTCDFCDEAIRNGYRYELLAYDDAAFEYVGIVFTGLPVVTLHVEDDGELGETYVPARVSIASAEHPPIDCAALTHLRGGGYSKPIEKDSYRIELYDETVGSRSRKADLSVLGMEADSDWLLLANAQDETAVRNYLAYDMWRRWNEDGSGLMMMDSRMVEVFVDDEYMGLYQLMQRIRPEKEIEAIGGNPNTDCMVRLVSEMNLNEKPWIDRLQTAKFLAEYRYAPDDNADRAFAEFENYVLLSRVKEEADDETFRQMAERQIDTDNMMSYFLFMQACGLDFDNVFNNLYIWMIWKEDRYVYMVSPWDMDRGLPVPELREDGAVPSYFDMNMRLPCRMLDLNVDQSREKIWALWEEKRSTVLSDDALNAWIMDVEEQINASGAYLRESEKWYGGAQSLNLTDMLFFEQEHMKTIEWMLRKYWSIDTPQE